ncbi:outer membrane lipid asymmetry maintenance protein MlaD [Acidithiobacillus ferriphilus]|jgi:ABC-type transport system involved in resistance to organic solvents, periplasmic component|uniref:outer membrane lipid asymmetry maintenance protein MlaD n=1 Tax=Acidithiobacillus ferriphilus TaxID=1689834 RepID=UPI001C07D8AD|nr:outer membrane lipid asymmetry maintenance protein MlaD [Acidithiobacillus ferriphilus]MDA8182277.1 outer membrane lipid asymmetry maintenance protein MlaD [Acidithiobacillus sp.]MBU2829325.1 outer membrane lipid asymmetry maintenance protein MlaD [Acidithiobacillus ferriphilus]MBU2832771.1 outer membrane lipid asymmetry maintenance protein MlaD [Acidithiobacillus ferriphilus]MBW9247610.1 outer membrane lipid asymmetry maintenance protein MlaD [Acidithiobacillus ferriphilus]MBW9253625.1 out
MEKRAIDWWVGIFVLLGIAALMVLALRVGNLSGFAYNDGYVLHANFTNVGSLKVRSPVRLGGVTIGEVTHIGMDPKTFMAKVTMRIEPKVKLPTDTGASIYTEGLLGEQYVAVQPGGMPQELKPGGTITMTQSAVNIDQLIGQMVFDKASGSK